MIKKYLITLGAVVFLIGASVSISAVSDSTNDIFHHKEDAGSVTGWSFEQYSGEKPNIDITDISYTVDGSTVTITLTVAGVIEDKEGLAYYVYIPHETALMGGLAYYTNSFYYEWGDTSASANSEMTSHAGTNTLTFEMDYEEPSGITDVWGYTYEVSDISASTGGEYWGDWAPDTYFSAYDQFYGAETEETTEEETTENETTEEETTEEETTEEITDDTSSTGTPGFEILTLVAAIGVVLIVLRKRK